MNLKSFNATLIFEVCFTMLNLQTKRSFFGNNTMHIFSEDKLFTIQCKHFWISFFFCNIFIVSVKNHLYTFLQFCNWKLDLSLSMEEKNHTCRSENFENNQMVHIRFYSHIWNCIVSKPPQFLFLLMVLNFPKLKVSNHFIFKENLKSNKFGKIFKTLIKFFYILWRSLSNF